jgi:hypothetical protein
VGGWQERKKIERECTWVPKRKRESGRRRRSL